MRAPSSLSRYLVIVGVVVLAAAVPSGPATATAPASHPANAAAPTTITSVRPVTAAGQLRSPYVIGRRYPEANCQSGSTYTGTAYRCAVRRAPQGVLDPCWVQADPSYAICMTEPWKHTVIRIRVTGGYDDSTGFAPVATPWGLRLSRTTRCLRNVGGVATTDGHPNTYYCSHRTVLVGSIERNGPTQRIHAYRRSSHQPHHVVSIGRVPIQIAWRGRPSRSD